jgi:hypothetical protein
MERQEVLRNDNPLELWGIVDEAALRRQVGGQAVMRAQVRHVLDASDLPNVTFQVIPFDVGAHAGMPGSFVFLQFADEAIPQVIYVDIMAGELFLERKATFAGRLVASISVQWLRPDASRSLLASIVAGE